MMRVLSITVHTFHEENQVNRSECRAINFARKNEIPTKWKKSKQKKRFATKKELPSALKITDRTWVKKFSYYSNEKSIKCSNIWYLFSSKSFNRLLFPFILHIRYISRYCGQNCINIRKIPIFRNQKLQNTYVWF